MEYLFEIIVLSLLIVSVLLLVAIFKKGNDKNYIDENFHIMDNHLNKLSDELKYLDSMVSEFKSPMQSINRYLTGASSLTGNIGEWGLQAIIEDVLVSNLYKTNHKPNPNSEENVEYAIKMPGMEDSYLSIDSKLPITAFESFLNAEEEANEEDLKIAKKNLSSDLTKMANDIKEKYIVKNHTPNFAIMFVIEKLNKAIDTIDGLREKIYKEKKVVILGPNNLVSYLETLKMAHQAVHVNSSAIEIFDKVSMIEKDFSLFDQAIKDNELRARQNHEVSKTLVTRKEKVSKKLKDLLENNSDK